VKPAPVVWLLLALLGGASALADTSLLVISGLGGDEEYSEAFHEWSSSLVDSALAGGIVAERVIWLAEDPERDPERVRASSRKEEVEKALAELAASTTGDDDLWIVVFGHGSARSGAAKVNLPGPDMSGEEFSVLLSGIPARRIVFVNAASASGDFVAALSAPNRAVVTATRSAAEQHAPVFGGFFVQGLAEGDADVDKDERVSLLEAFEFARVEVEKSYEAEQRMVTEHALLDDNGDGAGAMKPASEEESDGSLAGRLFLAMPPGSQGLTGEAAELAAKRSRLEERVAELRSRSDELPEDDYLTQLESLLVEIARISARLRALVGDEGGEPSEVTPQ
jgi:hypothetical protein